MKRPIFHILLPLIPVLCQSCTSFGPGLASKSKENIVVTIGPDRNPTITRDAQPLPAAEPPVIKAPLSPPSNDPVTSPKHSDLVTQQQALDEWKKEQKNKLYQFLFENGQVPIVTEAPKLLEVPVVMTSSGGQSETIIPATTRLQGLADAKVNTGRLSPFDPLTDVKPFPSSSSSFKGDASSHIVNYGAADYLALLSDQKKSGKPTLHIPSAPSDLSVPDGTAVAYIPHLRIRGAESGLVEAPAPQIPDSLPLNELPTPPEKPSIAKTFTPIGRIDDRVIIAINPTEAMAHGWPRTISLGAGDRFESVKVVKVTDDAITLDEDGDRVVLRL